ncbi:MAG: hypothetical protein M1814_004455 [Vezdaea aestivalis]|nr:MAG: hypothetical protein M1814_004455 [Vezdaea aestivalis]
MAYDDEAVRAKLSALNETQESIVTTAQWVMFHRRHAEHTTRIWLTRLKDSGSSKRLNLIYLANDIVQQSRARKKDDFPTAFSPIIAEATSIAYKGASNEVQQKLQRVIEVWRQRQIFEEPIQLAIERRISDINSLRTQSRSGLGSGMGSSLFSSSSSTSTTPVPPELAHLVPLQIASSRASSALTHASTAAEAEYTKVTDPSNTGVTPARQSAQLGGVLKTLSAASAAIETSLSARIALIQSLSALLESNQTLLAHETAQKAELASRKAQIEEKKQAIEDVILQELSAHSGGPGRRGSTPNGSPTPLSAGQGPLEMAAPEMEPLSPVVEPLTPEEPAPPSLLAIAQPAASVSSALDQAVAAAAMRPKRDASGGSMVSVKKMKFDDDDLAAQMGGDANGGLDDDVAAMLE